jgi:hypothetical protein
MTFAADIECAQSAPLKAAPFRLVSYSIDEWDCAQLFKLFETHWKNG